MYNIVVVPVTSIAGILTCRLNALAVYQAGRPADMELFLA